MTNTLPVNDVRALRVAEIVQDFRALQQQLSEVRAIPPPDEYYTQGYALLRDCISEGHEILQRVFPTTPDSPEGDPEQERQHLQ